jgi:hypothetical protein
MPLNVTGGSVIVAPGAQLRRPARAAARALGARLDNRGTLDISHPVDREERRSASQLRHINVSGAAT